MAYIELQAFSSLGRLIACGEKKNKVYLCGLDCNLKLASGVEVKPNFPKLFINLRRAIKKQ